MRRIERTTQFKRDFKREMKGRHRQTLIEDFPRIVGILANDGVLDGNCRDHELKGEWKDHRDCHVRPDLLLLYRKPDADTLQLVRIGSHSELGLG